MVYNNQTSLITSFIIFSGFRQWKFTEDKRLINRALNDTWKFGEKQWELKDKCYVDSLTGYLLGPNDKLGPGSLGFDPMNKANEFQSPSGTEVCKNLLRSVIDIFNLGL